MSWSRFDDKYAQSPKLVALGDWYEVGLALDVAGIGWCCLNETDGRLPKAQVGRLIRCANMRIGAVRVTPEAVAERLVQVGRWEDAGDRYVIHDFLVYNPSKADNDAKRAATAERVQRHRNTKRNGDCNALPPAPKQRSNTAPGPEPVPTELHTGVCSSPDAPPAEVSADAALDGIYPGEVYWPAVWSDDFDPTTRPVLAEIARVNAPKCADLRKQWAKFRAFALSENLRTRRWDQRWARWTLDHDARPCACGWNPHAARRAGVVSEEDRASAARGMALVLGRRRAGEVANG